MTEIQKQIQTPQEDFKSPEALKSREDFEYNLKFKKAHDKFPNLIWTQVRDNLFSMSTYGTDEIDLFLNDSALPYLNLENKRKSMQRLGVYESIFRLAGFEEKLENGIHKLIDLKTGKQIPPHSKEYFDAWQEILFYEIYRFINNGKIKDLNRNLYETLDFLRKGRKDIKNIRIKHEELFLKKMDLYILSIFKKDIEDFTPEIIKGWITDERFEKVCDLPTREEYKGYLEAGYISQELYNECMEIFDTRDRKKLQQAKITGETQKECKTLIPDVK